MRSFETAVWFWAETRKRSGQAVFQPKSLRLGQLSPESRAEVLQFNVELDCSIKEAELTMRELAAIAISTFCCSNIEVSVGDSLRFDLAWHHTHDIRVPPFKGS